MPDYIVYDNACKLQRFCENNCNVNNPGDRVHKLLKNKFVVDRLHIQGHTDPTCNAINHPDFFPGLNKLNTEVCEQINSWLAWF